MSHILQTLQEASGDPLKTVEACITIIDFIYVKCTYPRLGKRCFNNHLTQKTLAEALQINSERNNTMNNDNQQQQHQNTTSQTEEQQERVVETIASTLALMTSKNPAGSQIFTSKNMIETLMCHAFPFAKSSEAVEDLASLLCNLTSNNPDMKKAVQLLLSPSEEDIRRVLLKEQELDDQQRGAGLDDINRDKEMNRFIQNEIEDSRAMKTIRILTDAFPYAKTVHAVARLANFICNLVLNFPHDDFASSSISQKFFSGIFCTNYELLVQLFSGFSRVTSDDDNDGIFWSSTALVSIISQDQSPSSLKLISSTILRSRDFWNLTFNKSCLNVSTSESVEKLCSVLVCLIGERKRAGETDNNNNNNNNNSMMKNVVDRSPILLARTLLCTPETATALQFTIRYAKRTPEATEWLSYAVFYLCLENAEVFSEEFVDEFENELKETADSSERCRRVFVDAVDLMRGATELKFRVKLLE